MIILSLTLSSCSRSRVKVETPVVLPDTVVNDAPSVELPDRWWQAFGDENLNTLITLGLYNNFSLRTAWDRIEQARAIAATEGASLRPSLDTSADAASIRTKNSGRSASAENRESLGLVASYEIDLWGRVHAKRDAAVLDVSASAEDLQATAITLSAQIATTYFSLIERHAQLGLLSRQLEINRDHLDIVTTRFRNGTVSSTDMLQQQQLVENTEGQAILVRSHIDILRHQLAVLLGRPPEEMPYVTLAKALPTLGPLPAMGLPADLLQQRPDVRAAVFRIQAADQRMASAIADQFPRLGLTVRAETSSQELSGLFNNWLASLTGNLLAPMFDGGRREAEVRRTQAVVSERINRYGQIVLTSLQELEDALSLEARQLDYVASIEKQLELSNRAAAQTLDQYTKGTTDFLRYLTTLLSNQALQRQYVTARLDLVQYRVDLYRSLGGSWEMRVPPQARPTLHQESR